MHPLITPWRSIAQEILLPIAVQIGEVDHRQALLRAKFHELAPIDADHDDTRALGHEGE